MIVFPSISGDNSAVAKSQDKFENPIIFLYIRGKKNIKKIDGRIWQDVTAFRFAKELQLTS